MTIRVDTSQTVHTDLEDAITSGKVSTCTSDMDSTVIAFYTQRDHDSDTQSQLV